MGRIVSIGTIAALILSASLATWLKVDDERTLADQTAPWIVYFAAFLSYALVTFGAIMVVWLCARFILGKLGNCHPND